MYISSQTSSHRGRVLLPSLFLLGALAVPPCLAVTPPQQPAPLAGMFEADRERMAVEIVAIANRIANERQYFDVDLRPIRITGSFDLDKKVFHFDMEERFGLEAGYDELADMHRTVENAIEPLTSRVDDLHAISWSYGGKGIEYWMPQPQSAVAH